MTSRQFVSIGSMAALSVFLLSAIIVSSPVARANDDDRDGDSRVRRGLALAPVPLNLHRKNRELVGEGSYIVNVFECNGCHSAGPQTQYTPTGNPFTLSPPFVKEQTNPATYLGGGRDFGAFSSSQTHIISRNLTPDKTGLPIGGDTFLEFRNTIRTGVDPDHLHPVLGAPFNGALLQIMPWPAFRHMSDHDLRAIYQYLSAIPCVPSSGHVCF